MTDRAELEALAARLFWWKTPQEALARTDRFLAQLMTYGTAEDVTIARRHFPEAALRAVLEDPPAGVFDARSWRYWHVALDVEGPAEPPKRRL